MSRLHQGIECPAGLSRLFFILTPVLIDKTINEKFFILSLPSFAQVLENNSKDSKKADVILGVGLPIIHYSKQKHKFRDYFKRNNIQFKYNGKQYEVDIKDVYVWAQGYAGLIHYFHQYNNITRINLFDIGGYTLDALIVEKGILDIKSCISLPIGVVHLFNEIKQDVLSLGIEIQESQIEEILMGQNPLFIDHDLHKLIQKKAHIFVEDMLDQIKEYGYEMKMNPNIFMGGGALLLKNYIEQSKRASYIEFLDQYSNVKGYEILTKQALSKRR